MKHNREISFDIDTSLSIDPSSNLENCQRMGIMAAFNGFQKFENNFHTLMLFFTQNQSIFTGDIETRDHIGSSTLTISSSFNELPNEEIKVKILQ